MKKIIFLYFFLISLNFLLCAKDKNFFKIGSTETLESEGMKLKIMKDCSPNPIKPPQSVPMINKTTGEKFEFYNLFDLWRSEQIVSVWRGEAGSIYVAKVYLPVPTTSTIEGNFLLKQDYEKWRSETETIKEIDKDNLQKWLSAFFGLKNISDGEILPQKSSPQNCTVISFTGNSQNSNSTQYIYVLIPRNLPNARFAISYECTVDNDIERSMKAINSSISSVSFFTPKKVQDKPSSPPSSSQAKKIQRSSEYFASREAVINNIKNIKGWEFSETENFILVYNVKNKKTIRDMGENLERSRKVFQTVYPLKVELKAVSVCRFFQEREEYQRYLGAEYEWTAGLWDPSRKELIVSPMDWGSQATVRKNMIEVAYHEGFHQYIHYAVNEALTSVWFNEGNATFFEGIDFKLGDKFEIELTDRYQDIKSSPSVLLHPSKLIRMSYQDFIRGNISQNYTSAWALIFFLHKGSRVLKEKNSYHEIPMKYYDAIIETGDYKKADVEAWKDIDMEKFEKDFFEFWKDESLVKKAEKFNSFETAKK